MESAQSRSLRPEVLKWDFNVFECDHDELIEVLEDIFNDLGFIETFSLPLEAFRQFLQDVRENYMNIPYHGFNHAFDCLHFVFLLFKHTTATHYLYPIEVFALLVAALCHDVDHPGLTNTHQIKMCSWMALKSDNKSVLEKHHAELTLIMLNRTGLLCNFKYGEVLYVKKLIHHCILQTDLALHFKCVDQMNDVLEQVSMAKFSLATAGSLRVILSPPGLNQTQEESENHRLCHMDTTAFFGEVGTCSSVDDDTVYGDQHFRLLFASCLLKVADIGVVTKIHSAYLRWNELLQEEWFQEGDLERSLGLDVALPFDRFLCGDGYQQKIGFLDRLAHPLFTCLAKALPEADFLVKAIESNRKQLEDTMGPAAVDGLTSLLDRFFAVGYHNQDAAFHTPAPLRPPQPPLPPHLDLCIAEAQQFTRGKDFDDEQMVAASCSSPRGRPPKKGHRRNNSDVCLPKDRSETEVSLLATFVPFIARETILAHRFGLKDPSLSNCDAVIGFFDISGYSRFCEQLIQQFGAMRSAELLKTSVCEYMRKLLNAILKHGGDVVKFAGDALLCMWKHKKDSDCTLLLLTLRVMKLSLKLVARLNKYIPIRSSSFSLHVGLGVGEISSFVVGGEDGQWECFVAGQTVVDACLACADAQAGQVAITTAAYDLTSSYIHAESAGKDTLLLKRLNDKKDLPLLPFMCNQALLMPLQAYHESTLRQFVPVSAQDHCDEPLMLSEYRHCTTMMLKFPDQPDYSNVKCLKLFQRAVVACQRVFKRFDGCLQRLIMDDKGVRIKAVFGLPGRSCENASQRAVMAGAQLCSDLQRLGMTPAVGIATGRVCFGHIGSPQRREYTSFGFQVIIAARLMMMASDGQVLVDSTTFQESGDMIAYTPLAPVFFKGMSELSPIYLLASFDHTQNSAPTTGSDFIGRETELFTILDQVELVRNSQPALHIVLVAEAGMGKSALIARAHEQLPSGVRIMQCNAYHFMADSAYFVWRVLLEQSLFLDIDKPKRKSSRSLSPSPQGSPRRSSPGREMFPLPAPKASVELDSPSRLQLPLSPAMAFSLARELLPEGAGEVEEACAPTNEQRLRHAVVLQLLESRPDLFRYIFLLNDYCGTCFRGNQRALEPPLRSKYTQELLWTIMKTHIRSSRTPHFLTVEDASFVDERSMALLERLVSDEELKNQVVVLFSLRADAQQSSFVRNLFSNPRVLKLELAPLSRKEVQVLLRGALCAKSISPSLLDALMRLARGVPLLTLELAAGLQHANLLAEGPDGLSSSSPVTDDFFQGLPIQVQHSIASRIQRLPSSLLLILKVMSVIGATCVSYHLLYTIFPVKQQKPQLLQDLQVLVESGLVRKLSMSGAGASGGIDEDNKWQAAPDIALSPSQTSPSLASRAAMARSASLTLAHPPSATGSALAEMPSFGSVPSFLRKTKSFTAGPLFNLADPASPAASRPEEQANVASSNAMNDLCDLFFAFENELHQTAAYAMLSFTDRVDLHAAVARYIETHCAASLPTYYGVLARHLEAVVRHSPTPESTDVRKCVFYLAKDGEAAVAESRLGQGLELLSKSLALLNQHLSDDSEYSLLKLDIMTLLLPPLMALKGPNGDSDSAGFIETLLDQAMALTRQGELGDVQLRVHRLQISYLLRVAHSKSTTYAARLAEQYVATTHDLLIRLEYNQHICLGQLFHGKWTEALDVGEAALQQWEQAGSPATANLSATIDTVAQLATYVAVACLNLGNLRRFDDILAWALDYLALCNAVTNMWVKSLLVQHLAMYSYADSLLLQLLQEVSELATSLKNDVVLKGNGLLTIFLSLRSYFTAVHRGPFTSFPWHQLSTASDDVSASSCTPPVTPTQTNVKAPALPTLASTPINVVSAATPGLSPLTLPTANRVPGRRLFSCSGSPDSPCPPPVPELFNDRSINAPPQLSGSSFNDPPLLLLRMPPSAVRLPPKKWRGRSTGESNEKRTPETVPTLSTLSLTINSANCTLPSETPNNPLTLADRRLAQGIEATARAGASSVGNKKAHISAEKSPILDVSHSSPPVLNVIPPVPSAEPVLVAQPPPAPLRSCSPRPFPFAAALARSRSDSQSAGTDGEECDSLGDDEGTPTLTSVPRASLLHPDRELGSLPATSRRRSSPSSLLGDGNSPLPEMYACSSEADTLDLLHKLRRLCSGTSGTLSVFSYIFAVTSCLQLRQWSLASDFFANWTMTASDRREHAWSSEYHRLSAELLVGRWLDKRTPTSDPSDMMAGARDEFRTAIRLASVQRAHLLQIRAELSYAMFLLTMSNLLRGNSGPSSPTNSDHSSVLNTPRPPPSSQRPSMLRNLRSNSLTDDLSDGSSPVVLSATPESSSILLFSPTHEFDLLSEYRVHCNALQSLLQEQPANACEDACLASMFLSGY